VLPEKNEQQLSQEKKIRVSKEEKKNT